MPSSLSSSEEADVPAPLRVLIVDDSLDAAHTLARVLRLLGYDVETAHDGPAALDRAEQLTPQIVVLDLGLPGMSGYEVARRLRAKGATAKSLIVALSGYGHATARDEALAAGCNHYLLKPASIEQLQTIFEKVQ
jgi:two-component system, OmpR family, response regulator